MTDTTSATTRSRSGRSRSGRRRRAAAVEVSREGWGAALFLVIAVLLGGSSRFVLLPQLTLQILSLVAVGHALWRMTPERRALTRPFAWAVIAFGGLMAAQLVALPPGLWRMLPGHEYYATALEQVGLADRWRPWSMTPDLTRESLLGLLPVLAAAMLFAPLDTAGRRLMLDALLLCIGICALAFVFLLGSANSSFYDVGNRSGGGGVFANRNHLALLLACGIVVIFGRWRLSARRGIVPAVLLIAALLVTFAFLTVTGSRSGLLGGALALLAAGVVFARRAFAGQVGWRRFVLPAVLVVGVGAVLLVGSLSTRRESVDRLLTTRATLGTTELRTANFPATIDTAWAFFPLGSGFGSFNPVFRRFESDALLRPSYFNHAHNDAIEVLIEGGLPAVLLLAIAGFWLARRSKVLIDRSSDQSIVQAQVGLLGLMILCLGSLADYPLRTPFLAVLATLFATWVGRGGGGARSGTGLGTGEAIR